MAAFTEWPCDCNCCCKEAIGPFDDVYLNILAESEIIRILSQSRQGPNISLECKTQKPKMNCNKRYEMGGSHSGADENSRFLVYDIV